MNRLALAVLPLLLGLSAPAAAAECILDDEAFVIRSALPDDAATIDAQSAGNYPWFNAADPIIVGDHAYAKDGAPHQVAPTDIAYFALKDGVPFFTDAGVTADVPPVLYASVDPESCEVQPYKLAE